MAKSIIMIQIQNLHKSFGLHKLFDGISMQMTAGERLGLVGRNGHGKTTLFKIILGTEEYDEGQIVFPKNYKIGHLEQHLKFTKPTVLQEACLGLSPEEKDDHYKAEAILFGLGFTQEDMNKAPAEFSGGFQIRLNLAKLLVSKPNLMLLDEPTNYLDIVSVRWLVNFLKAWKDEMIIISHDRDFMDNVTTHTAAIHRQQLKKVSGSTTKLYEQIIQEEEIHEKTRLNDDKKRKQMDVFINRFRAKANKASVVQSRIKMRDKMPSLEKLSEIESLDFVFRHCPFPSKKIMEVENLSFGYTKDMPLIQDLSLTVGSHDRIAIVGKNGKGKSTLLNLLAGELTPNSGEIKMHPQAELGYFGQTNINRLSPKLTIEEEIGSVNTTLSRTVVRNICGTMMFDGDKAEKKIKVLSGGEKSRVMLGKILAKPSNILFLDEPTNHLDMESIAALKESIQEYPGAVILVTHSETLIRELANRLVVFHHNTVEPFPGSYDEFLKKIGWEEDENNDSSNSASQSKPKLTYEEKKALDKVIRKLKKDIQKSEQNIMTLEADLSNHNQELVKASENNDHKKLQELTKAIKKIEKNIDKEFEILTNLHTELSFKEN